jgi:hypothetical protein
MEIINQPEDFPELPNLTNLPNALADKYITRDFDEENKERKIISHQKEVDDLIGYAIHEGYLEDEAVDWSWKEKEDYYNKSMAQEPDEDSRVEFEQELNKAELQKEITQR